MHRLITCTLLLCSASAIGAGVGVQVDLNPIVPEGQKPTLNVTIKERVNRLVLDLTRSDGETIKKSVKRPRVRTRVRFSLPQPSGTFHYSGTLFVYFRKGFTGKIPLSFDTTVQPPLKIEVGPDAVDNEARTVRLSVNRPCVKITYKVIGDDGKLLGKSEEIYDPPQAAGKPFSLRWHGRAGVALKISLKAFDPQGFYRGVELYPWKIDIPHEDVVFASGTHRIPKSEQTKLDDAAQKIRTTLKRYGRWAPVKLWVVGHTDTVGGSASNRTLSMRRARAIANYLRKRGSIRVAIKVLGAGEDQLLVGTDDEVDEARNRRAEYVLSVEAPRSGAWQKR
jgi:outer membrane protein OmpA-like peptidoglycan-associated protein